MMLLCLAEKMSSKKALSYIGASNNKMYYKPVSKKR